MAAVVAAVAGMAVVSACGGSGEPLVVHTSLPASLRADVERGFEAANPGVDVRFETGDADPARETGEDAAAGIDVWWGASAETLERAGRSGRLLPYRPVWADSTGPLAMDGRSGWYPTQTSPFVIAFNRERLTLTRAPTEWSDLFHFRWVDDVAFPDPAASADAAEFMGAMLVEAIRDDDDLNRGFEWLARLDHQVESYAPDADEAIRSLRTGSNAVAILPRAVAEAARTDDAPWLHYRVPRSGTPILIRGAAISAGTGTEEAARRFVDYLGSPEALLLVKRHTHWDPAYGAIEPTDLPSDFELRTAWTPYAIATPMLTDSLPGWMDRWDREVRDR